MLRGQPALHLGGNGRVLDVHCGVHHDLEVASRSASPMPAPRHEPEEHAGNRKFCFHDISWDQLGESIIVRICTAICSPPHRDLSHPREEAHAVHPAGLHCASPSGTGSTAADRLRQLSYAPQGRRRTRHRVDLSHGADLSRLLCTLSYTICAGPVYSAAWQQRKSGLRACRMRRSHAIHRAKITC